MNPEILNPEILNPEILNPEILNPEILNPEILNPEILNPEILNPEILNPEILNPEILNNPRLTDITWTVRNDGNTTSSYTAKPFIAQELPEAANFRFQLLIYRIHATPAVNAITCELETEPLRQRQHHELIVDIRNPEILNPEILDPEILNQDPDVATFYAAPGETVRVTLRMLDPDITDEFDLNTDAVALATISHAVDSDDAANNETQPDVEVQTSTGVPIDILTTSLPDAITGSVYSATLVAAGGVPPLTWSEPSGLLGVAGTPCEGLGLDQDGIITGHPMNPGVCGPFTVQITDGNINTDTQTLTVSVAAEEWIAHYDGGTGAENGYDIVVDAAGNVYITGESEIALGRYLGVTVKYDASGNEIWSRSFAGSARAITLDSAGNIYVTGRSSSPSPGGAMTVKYDGYGNELWAQLYMGTWNESFDIAVDSLSNVYIAGHTSGSSSGDYLTIKYDKNGNRQWVQTYNGPGNGGDSSQHIALDPFGDIYVTGHSYGAGTDYDYATVKYDGNGNQIWIQRFDGPANSNDTARGIAIDALGDVYVTGASRDLGSTYHDYATVKYSRTGTELWVARYNGPANRSDSPVGIALSAAGEIFVTGASPGGNYYQDCATVKYDSMGNELWVSRYNGPANSSDYGTAIAVDVSGHAYVTGGSYNGSNNESILIKYDSDGNELWLAQYNSPENASDYAVALALDSAGNAYVGGDRRSSKGEDYTALKFDCDGNQIWASHYDGVGSDRAVDLVVDSSDNVYVTGHSKGGYWPDFATVKYDSSGNEIWSRRYDNPQHREDYPAAIALDASGGVAVTGYSKSNGAPWDDYATVKYDQDGSELGSPDTTGRTVLVTRLWMLPSMLSETPTSPV